MARALAVASFAASIGCGPLLGIEDLPPARPPADGGGGGATSSTATSASSSSSTGGPGCEPGPTNTCHLWSRGFGDAESQVARDTVVDAEGNVIVTGCFRGSVDFGGQTLESAGDYDGYLAKYDGGGALLWAKRFGDAASSYPCYYAVDVDRSGDIVLAGSFGMTVDFGGGDLVSAGAYDLFVAKLSGGGEHLWSRRFGDASSQETTSVAADSAGNVILGGHFTGVLDFGDKTFTSYDAEPDPFMAKLDEDGNTLWSNAFANAKNDNVQAVAVAPDDTIVVSGRAEATIDWGGGPRPELGGLDIVIAKYDPAGAHLWSNRYGSTANDYARRLAIDPTGAIVLTGGLGGAADFGAPGGPLAAPGAAAVVKLDADGGFLAGRALTNTDVYDVAAAASGAIYLGASCETDADFGSGSIITAGKTDAALVKLDPSLEPVWARVFGGKTDDHARGVGVSSDGAFLFGSFELTANFGAGPIASKGAADLFLLKYSP